MKLSVKKNEALAAGAATAGMVWKGKVPYWTLPTGEEKGCLVMLSGGVDSVAALKWVLENTEIPVLAHHVILKTPLQRWMPELAACHRIIGALQKIRPFRYTESGIDVCHMPGIRYDMAAVCLAAGALLTQERDYDTLVIGTCAEEGHNDDRWGSYDGILHGAMWPRTDRVRLMMPLIEKTKAEEMAYLGPMLTELSFGCRTPARGRPCGNCERCKLYEESKS